jgi:hypothetical protein
MMAQPQRVHIDIQDYFAGKDGAALRLEYLGGYGYAMTGGSMRHNRIAGPVTGLPRPGSPPSRRR